MIVRREVDYLVEHPFGEALDAQLAQDPQVVFRPDVVALGTSTYPGAVAGSVVWAYVQPRAVVAEAAAARALGVELAEPELGLEDQAGVVDVEDQRVPAGEGQVAVGHVGAGDGLADVDQPGDQVSERVEVGHAQAGDEHGS